MKIRTILTMAAAAGMLMSGTAFAEGEDYLSPYAQARVWAGIVNQNKNVTGTPTAATNVNRSDMDFKMMNGAARLGVKGKKGELEGLAEVGFGQDGISSATANAITTRKIYGVWTFADSSTLMFGQDEAPFTFYSNSATEDAIFAGFGSTNQDRDVQVKLTSYGAYVDLLNPTTSVLPTVGTMPAALAQKNIDVLFPKVAVGYDYKMKSDGVDVLVGLGGAGQVLKVDSLGARDVPADKGLDQFAGKKIKSALGYVHAKAKIGGFSVLGTSVYAVTGQNMGLKYIKSISGANTSTVSVLPPTFTPSFVQNSDKNEFKNTTSMEGFLDLGYDFTIFEVRAGAGYVRAKNAMWAKADAQASAYGQLNIPLVPKKLMLKPEFCYRDYLKDVNGVKQGHEWLAGAYLQANIE